MNKVSAAVQVRLDLRRPGSLPESLRQPAEALGGHRVTGDGVLVINAQRFRSQDRNRQDALDRVVALLRAAAERPIIRRATKPTAGSSAAGSRRRPSAARSSGSDEPRRGLTRYCEIGGCAGSGRRPRPQRPPQQPAQLAPARDVLGRSPVVVPGEPPQLSLRLWKPRAPADVRR